MADNMNNIRSYEVSIWTLQDRFLSVLKWSEMDCRGQIQEPEVTLRDDGTQEFAFAIPKYYYNGNQRIVNPMWLHLDNQPLEANMHKLKVIFNKNTPDEKVIEFLVTEVTHDHTSDNVDLNVKAEGLAFHELGKIGYKISLSEQNFIDALEKWEENGLVQGQPLNNIQFWNDIVFKDSNGNWRTNWTYEIRMDWSAFSTLYTGAKKQSDVLYEDEYVASWMIDSYGKLGPRQIQSTREKCRIIDTSSSNIYNITQTIAKEFGVYCRYEYSYNENYQITGRKVIYYNNYIQDLNGHIDLTYPYSSTAITRIVDSSNITTKMYVTGVEYDSENVTIMDVDANKTKEDYLLNFDYLRNIQGINEDQYEEIEDFEAQLYEINEKIIEVQERIRVIGNQLTKLEAEAKTYEDAIALDQERYEDAGRLRAELTGGTNLIPINGSPCTVLFKEEYGYYINIHWNGLDATSFKLYADTNFTGPTTSFTSPITAYTRAEDEFHNIIRIEHISPPNRTLQEGMTLWATGYYNPTLAYDNIQKVWAARLIYDQSKLKHAQQKIKEYDRYLNGASASESTSSSPLAIVWGDPGEPISKSDKTKSDRVGDCRIIANDDMFRGWDYDYFTALDQTNASPDLLYQEQQYLEQKRLLIDKFDRMMGPALREGYWNPENYHDYGDLFKTDVSIGYSDGQVVQPDTPHIKFIWDGDNYYDAEEPLLYDSNTAGNVEQHLTINLSGYLSAIANNIDNLYFVYCHPMNVAAINEINNSSAAIENKSAWLSTLELSKFYSYKIGSGCELGWVAQKSGSSWNRIPVLIVTGAKELDDDTYNFIRTGQYTTKLVSTDGRITTSTGTASTQYRAFIGTPARDSNGNEIAGQWVRLIEINSSSIFIGDRAVANQDYDSNGSSRAPTPQEYTWVRQYPRLYFDSLKLREEDIKIFKGTKQLTNYEDYYTVEDDRSVGLQVKGIGYYTTIKPEFLFSTSSTVDRFSVVYTLSNLDVAIYLDAIKVLRENANPKVSYEIETSVLNSDFVHTAYNRLNQIVHINDNDLQLENVSGYISSITLKLDKPWEDTVEIKNYETKFEDLFTTIVAQTEALKSTQIGLNNAIQAFTATGLIDPDVVQDSIRSANLALAFNSGKLTIDEEKGIWGVSDSGVVAFRGGGIFTATDRDTNGDWIWKTGILPGGINASLITAGQIDTNKIKIYAGDELRFQWNGEGLYAYKLLSGDYPYVKAEYEARGETLSDNLIDKKQYVVFNSNGLFLTSEADSYIMEENVDINNNVVYSYSKLQTDVNRVEISWKGLVLRNWSGEEVFKADPNTGNLFITGNIDAYGGFIGGWRIGQTMLEGAGIQLISGSTSGVNNAGIYLTQNQELCETVTINGRTYYIYRYTDPTTHQIRECYLEDFISPSYTLPAGGQVYSQETTLMSVEPRYTYSVYEAETQEDNSYSDTNQSDIAFIPTTGASTVYITKANNSTIPVKDTSGNNIIYDMTTNPDTTWYLAVKAADPSNYTDYIKEIYGSNYKEITISTSSSIVLTPVSTTESTFSVEAGTGKVMIRAGNIANFTINTDSLSGGRISNSVFNIDNYYTSNGVKRTFGDCFCDMTSDGEAGTFTLTRIDGRTANFNIAAMAAYQRAIAAAGAVSISLSYDGAGTVTGVATSGLGTIATTTLTIEISSDSSGTGGGGGCDNCSYGCDSSCAGSCSGACDDGCTGGCSSSCWGTCNGTCKGTSRGSCFIEGTKITLFNGQQIEIEKITPQTELLGYDEQKKVFVKTIVKIVQKFEHRANIVDLVLSNGNTLTLTKSHPVLTTSGWKSLDPRIAFREHFIWTQILQENDELITNTNEAVTVIKIIDRIDLNDATVYNIDVEPYDTYIAENIIVHNANSAVKA